MTRSAVRNPPAGGMRPTQRHLAGTWRARLGQGARLSVQVAPFGVFFVGSGLKTHRKPRSAPKGAPTMKIVAVDMVEKTYHVAPGPFTMSGHRVTQAVLPLLERD